MPNPAKLKPVCCDTPVVTSKLHSGVDFLTSTLKTATGIDLDKEISKALRALKMTGTLGNSANRHQFHGQEALGGRAFVGSGLVKLDDRKGKPKYVRAAMIDLPGAAIDALRARGLTDAEVLRTFASWQTSRLDYAIDTTAKTITPAIMARAWHAGQVTCKASAIREIHETRADGRKSHTAYFGSPQSCRMLRAYDKATQMDFVHQIKTQGPWTRIELQHRHEAADAAKHWLLTNGVDSGRQLVNGWITFRDPKSRAKDKCRRAIAPWWLEVVGTKKARSA